MAGPLGGPLHGAGCTCALCQMYANVFNPSATHVPGGTVIVNIGGNGGATTWSPVTNSFSIQGGTSFRTPDGKSVPFIQDGRQLYAEKRYGRGYWCEGPRPDEAWNEANMHVGEGEQLLRMLGASEPPPPVSPMGWRYWIWAAEHRRLVSPFWPAIWHDPELRAQWFHPGPDARGECGIHAFNMPMRASRLRSRLVVVGMVERFGKFARGTSGWRSEVAIIRSLRAYDQHMATWLQEAYPDVPVSVQ